MADTEQDVGAFDDLPPLVPRPVEVSGSKLLLVREGDRVHAVSATCPHAGAPLAEGVFHDGRLICPWHKAVFCVRTGALLDPPAVDPLTRYPVRVAEGRILVTLDDAAEPAPADAADKADDPRCFVIVGGGAAGAVAAQTLREEGFKGRLVILDRANRLPYDRTVLSKYHLSGERGAEKTPLQSQQFYREHAIERRTADVVTVDAGQRRIACADGSVLSYDAALLATGGEPRRPEVPGAELPGVFTLRSRADADAILARAERSTRAVVVGASFIGMEVAASLRERGLDVTVVGKEAVPFAKQLGAEIGAAFVALHERQGVVLRMGTEIARIDGEHEVRGITLKDGTSLPADLVVVGFGVTPATAPFAGLPRDEAGGLAVDATLRAAEGLYAAGDIASFPLRGDGERIRVEHWRVAEQQGRVAAHNMLGRRMRYEAVPVFWTIQYLKRLDYVGHAEKWDEIVVHGDLQAPDFLAYYVVSGRVAAAAGLGRDRDMAAIMELMTINRDWTPAALGGNPAEVLEKL